MTKYYCDCCGKEVPQNERIEARVSFQPLKRENWQTKDGLFCLKCASKLGYKEPRTPYSYLPEDSVETSMPYNYHSKDLECSYYPEG